MKGGFGRWLVAVLAMVSPCIVSAGVETVQVNASTLGVNFCYEAQNMAADSEEAYGFHDEAGGRGGLLAEKLWVNANTKPGDITLEDTANARSYRLSYGGGGGIWGPNSTASAPAGKLLASYLDNDSTLTFSGLPPSGYDVAIIFSGDGGKYGTNANNGIATRSGNGKQGGQTKVVHKRGSTTLGTYYVKGGFGGYGAKTDAHGEAITNGTSSSQTTPNGTCYANGNVGCSYSSYSGESGTSTKGGNGGRVKNEGSITNGLASSGGYLYIDSTRTANQRATDEEIRLAKGQNATEPGFGGGGGLTPAWATGTSHFYQGGKGGNGKVDITYKVSLPGGGGGSGARVGGYTSDNKMYEIKYKVKEGDRVVFKVGSGGSGGVSSQDGLNGSATVVGDNEIVFMAGEGGKTSTNDDKNNLRGGRGGYSSYINEEDIVQSNVTSGIKIKNTTNTTYTFKPSNNSFKGQNGKRGGVPSSSDIQSGYSLNNTIFNYGFSGGMGASPFGIAQSKIGASITCGGGNIVSVSNIAMTLGQMTNINYLCTSGNIKGNDARSHDPVNNEFGGSGGGGGGVVDDSFELGSGGSGSSGYLRIRWDASEQE